MNSQLRFAAVALLSMTSLVAMAQGAGNSPSVSTAHDLTKVELDQLLAHPDNVLVIDVRRPDEVSSVGGFPVYLSVQLKELENSLAWIPRDRTVVVVSNHAGRARKAAVVLAQKGFKVAGAAGAQTYEQAGGKIAHIAVPPAREGAAHRPGA